MKAASIFVVFSTLVAAAWFPEEGIAGLHITAGRVEATGIVATGVHLDIEDKGARLETKSLHVATRQLEHFSATCPHLELSAHVATCSRLSLPQAAAEPLALRIDTEKKLAGLDLSLSEESWRGRLSWTDEIAASLEIRGGQLKRLAGLLDFLPGIGETSRINGKLHYMGGQLTLAANLAGFAFDAGEQGAERLTGTVNLSLSRRGGAWKGHAETHIGEGTLYLHPFLFGAGTSLTARGHRDKENFAIDSATLSVAGTGELLASLAWRNGAFSGGDFRSSGLDLAGTARVLRPWLAERAMENWTFAGLGRGGFHLGKDSARGRLAVATGKLATSGGLGLEGVDADLPFGAPLREQGHIAVASGRWGGLAFGPWQAAISAQSDEIDAEPMEIPILGGSLKLDKLHIDLAKKSAGADAALTPVSMEKLTAALGLPPLPGTVSAVLPSVTADAEGMRAEGASLIRFFDGTAVVRNLNLANGPPATVGMDIDARRLDLAKLTGFLSFGHITGRADINVRGLQLVDGSPTAFTIALRDSEGRYERRISQEAVADIGSLGGAGGSIQGALLGLFRDFGYAHLGFDAHLKDGVLDLGGIADRGSSFVLVEGGGLPAITVLGYNRHVQWSTFIERLSRVSRDASPTKDPS